MENGFVDVHCVHFCVHLILEVGCIHLICRMVKFKEDAFLSLRGVLKNSITSVLIGWGTVIASGVVSKGGLGVPFEEHSGICRVLNIQLYVGF